MSLLAPIALWLAAIAIPVLLLLYFLKLRRRVAVVSSTLLWRKAVEDLQVNAPFQRLRRNLLLFLQILILVLAIVALARPGWRSLAGSAQRIVILIDHSASMNVQETEGVRLGLAKQQARRAVEAIHNAHRWWSVGVGPRIMVVSFAAEARIVSGFNTSLAEVVRSIESIPPTDGQTRLRDALQLARAHLQSTSDDAAEASEAQLLIVSDGCFGELEWSDVPNAQVSLLRVGQAFDNVGIRALRAERSYAAPERVFVSATVENYSPDPVQTDLTFHVNGVIAGVRPVELAPAPDGSEPYKETTDASRVTLSAEFPCAQRATIEARLSRSDALSVDNQAFAVVPPPRQLSVLVVTAGNKFLELALRSQPVREQRYVTLAQFENLNPEEWQAEGRTRYDVLIFDRFSPPALPAGNYLFLGAAPPGGQLTIEPAPAPFDLVWWDEAHPALRNVAVNHVYVARGGRLAAATSARVLAESAYGPVLVETNDAGRHSLVLSFPPEQSNWVFQPGFPKFLYNCVQLLGGAGGAAAVVHNPGDTLEFSLPANVDRATVHAPHGTFPVDRDPHGRARFSNTRSAGLYRIEPGAPGQDVLAVALDDPHEGRIRPPEGASGLGGPLQRADPLPVMQEIWRWFVGCAAGLALMEWWLYNRRLSG